MQAEVPGFEPVQREPRPKVPGAKPHRGPRASPYPPGPPPYVPTEAHKKIVMALRACGEEPRDVARVLQISENTLRKYFRDELDHGHAIIRGRIGAKVVQKALAGDNSAAAFWLRNHGGPNWQDKQRHEHTGADGTPLAPPNLIVTFLQPDEPAAAAGS